MVCSLCATNSPSYLYLYCLSFLSSKIDEQIIYILKVYTMVLKILSGSFTTVVQCLLSVTTKDDYSQPKSKIINASFAFETRQIISLIEAQAFSFS